MVGVSAFSGGVGAAIAGGKAEEILFGIVSGAMVGMLNHAADEKKHKPLTKVLKRINDLAGKLSTPGEIIELYKNLDAWKNGDITAMSRINDQLMSHFMPPLVDVYVIRIVHAGAESINKEATRTIELPNSANKVVFSNGPTFNGVKSGRTYDNSYNQVYVP